MLKVNHFLKQPLLIIEPAGSGKTVVTTRRLLASLVQRENYSCCIISISLVITAFANVSRRNFRLELILYDVTRYFGVSINSSRR